MSDKHLNTPIQSQPSVFRWGAATHVGNVRISNQDKYGITSNLMAVADGMGGHNGGEVAAEIAVTTLTTANRFKSINEFAYLVQKAHHRIQARAQENINLDGMGTTLCALSEIKTQEISQRIGAVNVGDSRIYLFTNNKLHQISIDHSVVQELVDSGQITEFEAKSHPHRNVITRSLGHQPIVKVDAWEMDLIIGDRYLLCSDGLTNEISDTEIAEILSNQTDPQQAVDQLIQSALENEGLDNVTAIVVDVISGKEKRNSSNIQFEVQVLSPEEEKNSTEGKNPNALKSFIEKITRIKTKVEPPKF
tara:strand:+ start:417 stop:1334 length:918 start_codon:yes stop_codon:yes gene_type:complete